MYKIVFIYNIYITDGTVLDMCSCLLFVCYFIAWAYFTHEMPLGGCYAITGIFMSLFMSSNFTTE